MISSILLAAGQSRRMGSFKQLMLIDDKTFVERCVESLLASIAGEVVVVTGHREAEVRAVIGARPVKFAYNPEYLLGMSSSIKRGMMEVSGEARAVLIALADQPQITTNVIDLIIRTYLTERALVVVPAYRGKRGHPILVDISLRQEVLRMDPDQGLRQVVNSHRAQTHVVAVDDEAVLIDVDTPQDYKQLTDRAL